MAAQASTIPHVLDYERQRYQGHRMATAPEETERIVHSALFRHATDPLQDTLEGGSGAASPTRHSFDSDLRNHFTPSRRHSMLSEPGHSINRTDTSASLYDFVLTRYNGRLLPISQPPKEKEKLRSFTKLITGSWQRKPSISTATNPQHVHHVELDPYTGEFVGLPKEWERVLFPGSSSALTNPLSPYPSNPLQPSNKPPFNPSVQSINSKRFTLSSATDSFYSYNSRYNLPAERPPSFPATIASTHDDDHGGVDASRTLTTPRPLPHIPI
ncbi:hypothetical protein M408DRAFT_333653 [Serendipita vermifera MAFF 305830]|uniref:CRIB domain-containing protein n=1 Tax=Serendipita vermifera MAFF 305830 TaxID=933852 RepID=A0A0C2WUP8_SERVB|nr:hypothetical protein M408DRAFT_333653 [Serendipita vermifera MAFF 305830]